MYIGLHVKYRVTDGNRTFLKWLVGGSYVRLVGEPASLASLYNAISVAMEQWTVELRVFAYHAYVRNGESVTAVQRLFRVHFILGRRETVPSCNTILRWIHSLRTTGSIVKKKPPGPKKTKDARKHREDETSADSEPRAVCTKTRA